MTNKTLVYILDNSSDPCISEVEITEDGSEWGIAKLVNVVKYFNSVSQAEKYADKNDIFLYGEVKNWKIF